MPASATLFSVGASASAFSSLSPALEHAEDQLVALLAVLAQQRREPLHRGRLQRLEAVGLVDALDDADDIVAPQHIERQEIAHAAERLG